MASTRDIEGAKQHGAAITALDFAFFKQNQCCLELQV
jgi:hypothetical protein